MGGYAIGKLLSIRLKERTLQLQEIEKRSDLKYLGSHQTLKVLEIEVLMLFVDNCCWLCT
jgi:hypothetical protein